ncbi:MAG: hypothetical protein V2A76_12515 [Planctomycetota bacterium]
MRRSLQPVRLYRDPRFPTWADVRRDHSLLLEHVPLSWIAGGRARRALIASCLGLTAGTDLACSQAPSEGAEGTADNPLGPVAAVFEHGEGRGAYGCIAVCPPVFLSEEEARQVIGEELSRQGLKLEPDGKTLRDIPDRRHFFDWRGKSTRTLVLDGFDAERGAGYEFISRDEYYGLRGSGEEASRSSVDWYDFLESARSLAARVNASDSDARVGVFYDPVTDQAERECPTSREQQAWDDAAREAAREESRDLLRLQVRDFAEWLREQGVLR